MHPPNNVSIHLSIFPCLTPYLSVCLSVWYNEEASAPSFHYRSLTLFTSCSEWYGAFSPSAPSVSSWVTVCGFNHTWAFLFICCSLWQLITRRVIVLPALSHSFRKLDEWLNVVMHCFLGCSIHPSVSFVKVGVRNFILGDLEANRLFPNGLSVTLRGFLSRGIVWRNKESKVYRNIDVIVTFITILSDCCSFHDVHLNRRNSKKKKGKKKK